VSAEFFAEVEGLASGADDDITDVLPQVHQLIAAIDYAIGLTRAPLFEPTESNSYRLADGFLRGGDDVRVLWHPQSSFAARPDEEPYSMQWRESEEAFIGIEGGGGLQIVNVASASIGPLQGSDLRYRHFTFHTARIPVRGGLVSESRGGCYLRPAVGGAVAPVLSLESHRRSRLDSD
jgi:hypothetical protein